MLPNRKVLRVFLIAAIAFELILALASTVYLSVASPSFLLVIVALLLSIAGIVARIRKAGREDARTLYGEEFAGGTSGAPLTAGPIPVQPRVRR